MVRKVDKLVGGISHVSIHSSHTNVKEEDNDRSFRDIAVLYRLSQQADILSQMFEKRGIPFQVVGVKLFFMKSAVVPAYYWIRGASNREATVSLALLEKIKGIGEVTLHQMEGQLPVNCSDFFDVVDKMGLSTKVHEKVREVYEVLNLFKKNVAEYGLAEALKKAMDYLDIDAEQPDPKRLLELAGAFI